MKKDTDDSVMQRIIERERDRAAADRKEDVAKRPASFKSAISLSLPVGTTRSKRDRERHEGSPERKHVLVENPAAYKEVEDGGKKRDRADD